jgi:hypothetical protein
MRVGPQPPLELFCTCHPGGLAMRELEPRLHSSCRLPFVHTALDTYSRRHACRLTPTLTMLLIDGMYMKLLATLLLHTITLGEPHIVLPDNCYWPRPSQLECVLLLQPERIVPFTGRETRTRLFVPESSCDLRIQDVVESARRYR